MGLIRVAVPRDISQAAPVSGRFVGAADNLSRYDGGRYIESESAGPKPRIGLFENRWPISERPKNDAKKMMAEPSSPAGDFVGPCRQ